MSAHPVKRLLLRDDPNIVSQSISIRAAAERLLISGCEVLAVTDESGALSGVVTESSVVRSLLGQDGGTRPISTIVCHHVESIRDDAPLQHVLHLFRASCHSAVPVLDSENRVCGLLRRRDVMQCLLNGDVAAPADEPPFSVRSSGASTAVRDVRAETTVEHRRDPLSRPNFLKGEAARRRLLRRDDDSPSSSS